MGPECNEPPICEAGPDVATNCDGVAMDATASDPDGDVLLFAWSSSCGGTTFAPGPDVEDPIVSFGSSCGHSCTLTLVVDDQHGATCTDTLTVAIDDVTPPVFTSVPPGFEQSCSGSRRCPQ